MAETNIEWTHLPGYVGKSWNAIRGCSRVSEGCRSCYAEAIAARFSDPGLAYEGLARRSANGPRWTGEVRFIPEKLDEPLRARKPTCWFVNSMSDLFHEKVPDETIAAMFGVMAACPQHLFLALTKRAERMARWFEKMGTAGTLYEVGRAATDALGQKRPSLPLGRGWPLPGVWLGVSVEDQATADERIPYLLGCPAAVRWLSLEPQLGPVDLTHLDAERARHPEMIIVDALRGRQTDMGRPCADVARLDWVVQGGESGPGARPFDLAWARSVRDQCQAAGVSYFLKQLGSRPVKRWSSPGAVSDGAAHDLFRLTDRKGGDPAEWPDDLRVREWPTAEPPAKEGV